MYILLLYLTIRKCKTYPDQLCFICGKVTLSLFATLDLFVEKALPEAAKVSAG